MKNYTSAIRAALALFATVFLALAAWAAPEWCARPIGAGTREAMWTSIQPLLPMFRQIAGGDHFAVIRTPKFSALASQAEQYREGFKESAITTFLADKELMNELLKNPKLAEFSTPQDNDTEAKVDQIAKQTDGKYSREAIRVAIFAADKKADEDVAELREKAAANGDKDYFDTNSKGQNIGVTYVYSPVASFKAQVGIEGIDHGATLLTTGDELDQVYNLAAGFKKNFEGIKFIFVDNITPGQSSPLEASDRMIARIPALNDPTASSIIDFVHGRGKGALVFSLLPESESAAAPWGLDQHLTRLYASAGKTIAGAIKKSRLNRGAWTTGATLAAAIEKAAGEGLHIYLVGESANEGKVRLAGRAEIFDPAVLSDDARKATFFLFCNSSAGSAARTGFSIEGRIYSDTVAGLLGTLAAEGTTENSRAKQGPLGEWLKHLVEGLDSDTEGTKTVSIYRYAGKPTPAVIPPNPIEAPAMPYYLILYGAFGGLCSEYFRWRALLKRPRGKLYVSTAYIALSAMFVILAGGVGFVLGRLAPTDLLQTISAFIAGVGLEEVVKRAARLQKPNVPFDKSGVGSSLQEFVAG